MENLILIHYGNNKFSKTMFTPVKNRNWNKPTGGLWTSPLYSSWGWKDWCHAENFRECTEDNSFIITLKENARVLKIDTRQDLYNVKETIIINAGPYARKMLDFELLAKNYDAIWLTENGQIETRFPAYYDNISTRDENAAFDLYGWDCESVLILNKEVILQYEMLNKTL